MTKIIDKEKILLILFVLDNPKYQQFTNLGGSKPEAFQPSSQPTIGKRTWFVFRFTIKNIIKKFVLIRVNSFFFFKLRFALFILYLYLKHTTAVFFFCNPG